MKIHLTHLNQSAPQERDPSAVDSSEQKGKSNCESHHVRNPQTAPAAFKMARLIRAAVLLLRSIMADPVRPCGAGINGPSMLNLRRHGL